MRKESLKTVFDLAKKNKKIIFIGSDLSPGILNDFKKKYPERFFMEGISEQHIAGMAAGFALNGFIPYVNTITTFLTRRCYEQLQIDISLLNLPVRLIGNGGGFVYGPLGPTHISLDDIFLIRSLSNFSIIVASDSNELRKIMTQTANLKKPIYFRIAKGGDKIISKNKNVKFGKAIEYFKGKGTAVISTGIMTSTAIEVRNNLKNKKKIKIGVYHFHTIRPIDKKKLKEIFSKYNNLIILEEHFSSGGLFTEIIEYYHSLKIKSRVEFFSFGVKNMKITKYGNQEAMLAFCKLDTNSVIKRILKIVKSQ